MKFRACSRRFLLNRQKYILRILNFIAVNVYIYTGNVKYVRTAFRVADACVHFVLDT